MDYKKAIIILSCLIFSFGALTRVTLADCTVGDFSGSGSGSDFGTTAGVGQEQAATTFTPGCSGTIASSTIFANKNGSPVDHVQMYIEADNAGKPSGTPLGTSNNFDINALGSYTVTYGTPVSVTSGTKYWVVAARTGTLDSTNDYAWTLSNNGAATSRCYFDGTNWTCYSTVLKWIADISSGGGGGGGGTGTTTVATSTITYVESGGIEYELAWIIFGVWMLVVGLLWNVMSGIFFSEYGKH